MSKAKSAVENQGWKKPAKTILKSGITYSLATRVHNAMHYQDAIKAERTNKYIEFIDGRGSIKRVPEVIVMFAEQIGAKFLKTVKSSYLRPRMQFDFKAKQVTLIELKKDAKGKSKQRKSA